MLQALFSKIKSEKAPSSNHSHPETPAASYKQETLGSEALQYY